MQNISFMSTCAASWYLKMLVCIFGVQTDFQVEPGKMGKRFQQHLAPEAGAQAPAHVCRCDYTWDALLTMGRPVPPRRYRRLRALRVRISSRRRCAVSVHLRHVRACSSAGRGGMYPDHVPGTCEVPRHARRWTSRRETLTPAGVAYYPEHWPSERLAAQPHCAGITRIRTAEFAWHRMSRAGPASTSPGWRKSSAVGSQGILTILGTPTPTYPAWLMLTNSRHPPGQEQRAGQGIRSAAGRVQDDCYRGACVADRRAHDGQPRLQPHVVAWQTDNAVRCHDTAWLTTRRRGRAQHARRRLDRERDPSSTPGMEPMSSEATIQVARSCRGR